MIPLFKVYMDDGVDAALAPVLHGGFVGQGAKVDLFEERLREYLGVPFVLTTNSGTSALHLAYRLAGIGSGDRVISTAMTCFATNAPLLERGARIEWADVDPRSGNIDADDVDRRARRERPKAIVAVDFGGMPCDYPELNDIAQRRGAALIEDAAHSFGAEFNGKTGCHADFVAFSFQAIKTLTTVDGGALVCRREEDYRRGKLLRWYGIDREDKARLELRCEADIAEAGYKFHMNDVNATIGIENLKSVPRRLARVREIAAVYDRAIPKLRGARIVLTRRKPDRLSSFWLYPVMVDQPAEFIAFLKARGIHASPVHLRNDVHSCLRASAGGPLAGLDFWADHQVSIPVGAWLSDADVAIVLDALEEYSRE